MPTHPTPLRRFYNFIQTLTPQTIIATMATIVSLCSLFLSIYQTKIMIKQQNASVWPNLLLFSTNYMENNEFSQAITLWNQGIGPAIIQDVKVEFRGKVYNEAYDAVRTLYHELGRDSLTRSSMSLNSMGTGFSFAPNQNWEWIRIGGEGGRVLQEHFGEFKIRVKYSSVYGETWETRLGYADTNTPKPVDN